MRTRIGLASDHGGFEIKQILKKRLEEQKYEVVDYGNTRFDSKDDYPDFVLPLAKAVSGKEVVKGIAICGSGVGASIAANKIAGARAALVHDHFSAHQGVEDDDMNILCMGGSIIGIEKAKELAEAFLEAVFSNEERHLRRLKKTQPPETDY
ncbi:MAG: RpiB/LacA/LacB family sugar-phosphate isomerase [Bacteroidales bacterium]|nr:RpiB/LacA/LacB family sugar-phosphate isomerase [Bacteroidales bacterium]MDT8374487.1 RpiB/LacA/LacB family sugar-phosphate isomerase [Bacteroidales bacterium]